MSKISIDSEGRIHIEDEPKLRPQEAAAPPKLDTPADVSGSPSAGNTVSRESARNDSSRLAIIFFAAVAVLAAVFCAIYFGSNSGTGPGSSGVSSRTTVPTASSSTQSKPSTNTLTAEDRIVTNYSMYDNPSNSWSIEHASQLMPDFKLPFTLDQLAASSPSELSESLSKLTEHSGTSDYHRFTGRGKMQLFKDEFTNPEALEYREDPWGITVDTKDENGESIGACSLADIKKAAEIEQIKFVGDLPIENPTYGDICEHVAQVFDYERIGLEQITMSNKEIAVQGSVTADGRAAGVWVDFEAGYITLTISYDPKLHSYESEIKSIEESAFQACR